MFPNQVGLFFYSFPFIFVAMTAFLKLIRLPNLLIIAFTMYMIRYCLILPIIEQAELELQMPDFYFFLIVLSTVMVAAAGYIINDYFDRKIDAINKPDEIVVDKGIKRRVAMGAHYVITTVAVFIGVWVSYVSGLFMLGTMIFIFCTASLWFYSTTFKRQFLVGNVLISILAGLIPLIAALFEMTFTSHEAHLILPDEIVKTLNQAILTILSGYAFFAFIISLIREIIKDTEDYEGDAAYSCKTLPVVLGINFAKYISAFLALCVSGLIAFLMYTYLEFINSLSSLQDDASFLTPFYYVLFAIQIPLLALFVFLLFAKEKKHFRRASFLTKLIMLGGICFLFVLRHQLVTGNWQIV